MIDFEKVPASPAEVLDLVKTHGEWVAHCLQDSRDSWMPNLQVLTRDGPAGRGGMMMFALAVPFNEDAEKRGALEQIGRNLYRQQILPAAAVLSAEAWAAPDRAGGAEPRHHPDKQEIIALAASSIGGGHAVMQAMHIGRDPENRILVGPWEPPQTEGVTTVLVNFLWKGYFAHVAEKFGIPRKPERQ